MDRELEEEYSKRELEINYDKTEYSRTDPSENLETNGNSNKIILTTCI